MENIKPQILKNFRKEVNSIFLSKPSKVSEALEDYLEVELWTEELPSVSGHLVAFSQSVKELSKYLYYTGDPDAIMKAEFIKKQQMFRFSEVSNLRLNDIDSGTFLINLTNYYDALFVLDLILANELNQSAIGSASAIISHGISWDKEYAKMFSGEKPAEEMFVETLALEMVRRGILEDYQYICDVYERVFNYDIFQPVTGIFSMIIKFCYIISKLKLKPEDIVHRYGAKTILTFIKYSWLDSLVHRDYWGLEFYNLILIELAYNIAFKSYSGQFSSLLDKIRPDSVIDDVEEILEKIKKREKSENIRSLSLAKLLREGI